METAFYCVVYVALIGLLETVIRVGCKRDKEIENKSLDK